jgi:molecular chaperone DnaK
VTVRVFQGEREMASDNRLLGQFNLEGIPPAARGMPQIDVTFDIDANGILNVSAKDKGTGKEQKIRIESSSGLSPADVEKMRRDAESHAADDKRKRELIDARNQADQMVYSLEKLLKEHEAKISESDRAPIRAAIEKVKTAQKGDDVNAINQAVNELQQASHAMSQHLYSQGGPPAGGPTDGAPSGDGKPKDDVIDAEFEVKK